MKMYTTLSEAISMAVDENGEIDTWEWEWDTDAETFFAPIYLNLKIAKKCTIGSNLSDCGIPDDLTASYLNHHDPDYPDDTGEENYGRMFNDPGFKIALLNDGSFLSYGHAINDSEKVLGFTFDVNGIKGPNVMGRDIFELDYLLVDGKYKFSCEDLYKRVYGTNGRTHITQSHEDALESVIDDCSLDTESADGLSCSGRLILEGKMNY